ncbi:hypothetical protein FHG87_015675 [Trinorchestia longiramus]|nr:hypothetical protein FHG87_015675 [Trinorchestia longiramus]
MPSEVNPSVMHVHLNHPTALYNEAATLCVADSLPSTSKVNISTKNSHHLNSSTYTLTANSSATEAETNHPVCGPDGLKQHTH